MWRAFGGLFGDWGVGYVALVEIHDDQSREKGTIGSLEMLEIRIVGLWGVKEGGGDATVVLDVASEG